MAGDPPLQRCLLPEVGDEVVQDGAVEDSAGHALHPGGLTSLDEKDLQAGPSQGIGCGAARGTGADHDGVEGFLHGCRKYSGCLCLLQECRL